MQALRRRIDCERIVWFKAFSFVTFFLHAVTLERHTQRFHDDIYTGYGNEKTGIEGAKKRKLEAASTNGSGSASGQKKLDGWLQPQPVKPHLTTLMKQCVFERHYAVNIQRWINEAMDQFEISEDQLIAITIDSGANVTKAVDDLIIDLGDADLDAPVPGDFNDPLEGVDDVDETDEEEEEDPETDEDDFEQELGIAGLGVSVILRSEFTARHINCNWASTTSCTKTKEIPRWSRWPRNSQRSFGPK